MEFQADDQVGGTTEAMKQAAKRKLADAESDLASPGKRPKPTSPTKN